MAVFTATFFVEYRISFTTLLYMMGRPSVKAATNLKFPPACQFGAHEHPNAHVMTMSSPLHILPLACSTFLSTVLSLNVRPVSKTASLNRSTSKGSTWEEGMSPLHLMRVILIPRAERQHL